MFRRLSTKPLLGSDIVINSLLKHKVDTIFGYNGGAILPIFDKLYDTDIKYIMNRHEQSSGHSAEGYAKVTGKPGIVITTSGPGVTNLITPLQDSYSDGVPMVVLTGQVPTSVIGSDAFQECNAIELTKPCTKWNYQVRDPGELEYIIDEAFRISLSGRPGPVHIDLPKDIISAEVGSQKTYLSDSIEVADYIKKDEINYKDLDELCDIINKAEKVVIYAGQGSNNYSEVVRELAIKANIPVTTTLHAVGVFDEEHPLSLEMLGMHGSAYANYTIQDADLILAIGARFDDRTIGNKSGYAPKAREAEKTGSGGIFQFEISKKQVGKTIVPTKVFLGDCGEYLRYMANKLKYNKRSRWISKISRWKKDYPFYYEKENETDIKTQQVIEEISNQTKNRDDIIVTTGVGNHQMMACQFYKWRYPKRFISSGSLGTMGVGVPFSIGAQLAEPDKTIICIDGDGSFNMTMNELGTIAEYKLPVKIAIMNDSRQQMVYVWQELFFNSRIISTINHNPDYNKLAESFGIYNIVCDSQIDLEERVTEFIEYPGPILANFIVKPDICLPLVAPGKNLDEMLLQDIKNIKLEGLAPN